MDGESQSLDPVPPFGLPPPPTPVQRSILQAYQPISSGIFEVLLTPLPWRATVMPCSLDKGVAITRGGYNQLSPSWLGYSTIEQRQRGGGGQIRVS